MRVFVVTILLALLFASVAPAMAYTVTLTVIGPDGKAVSGATVTLYDTAGNKYENKTNIKGVTIIEVPSNGTYLVVVKSSYYILDTVSVVGDTSKTVNATAMHYANITSNPIAVTATVMLQAFNYTKIDVTTNVTVYAPSAINVSYPNEVVKFPYKYVFEKAKYDGVETNETTVALDMTTNYQVTAYYNKTFYMTLEYWTVAILVAILAAAVFVAWVAGAKTAKSMIEKWREERRRFVRRK